MTTRTPPAGAALTASVYVGRMPARAGDMAVEAHGIAPVPVTNVFSACSVNEVIHRSRRSCRWCWS